MTETAHAVFQNTNPVINPTMYWRVSAFALTGVALLGILINTFAGNSEGISGFLVFDWTHNIVHVVLAGAAFIFGFAPVAPAVSKTFAIIFGFVYAGLGVFGFFADLGAIGLGLELGENLIHILLGAWALAAGFMARY